MATVKIQMDTVLSRINKPNMIDKNFLSYEKEGWRRSGFRNKKYVTRVPLISKDGIVYTGLVPRIKKYLNRRDCKVKVEQLWDLKLPKTHMLQKGVLRDYQEEAVSKILKSGRGVWVAPPRSGKTFIAAGVISAFPKGTTVTYLVHTIDLLEQAIGDLTKFFGESNIGYLGAGRDKKGPILIVTRQTFAKRLLKTDYDSDIVIVDECHHVASFNSDYASILTSLESPVRLGLTATPKKDGEAALACEAFLGPKIGETTHKQLISKKALVKPKIKLLRVPESDKYKFMKGGYSVVYNSGVVENRKRNLLIVNYAARAVEKGKAVLIMVEKINHGKILLDMLQIKAPGVFVYLHGSSTSEERMKEKLDLGKRKRLGVIATRIWIEGVTIPALDVVINAAGGESEVAAIQKFGRGMGTFEGKKKVILVDLIDTNHIWFQRHSLSRICYYSEWKWL